MNEWYWAPKLRRNMERDRAADAALAAAGWRVVRVWEHESLDAAIGAVIAALGGARAGDGPARADDGPARVGDGPARADGSPGPARPFLGPDRAGDGTL